MLGFEYSATRKPEVGYEFFENLFSELLDSLWDKISLRRAWKRVCRFLCVVCYIKTTKSIEFGYAIRSFCHLKSYILLERNDSVYSFSLSIWTTELTRSADGLVVVWHCVQVSFCPSFILIHRKNNFITSTQPRYSVAVSPFGDAVTLLLVPKVLVSKAASSSVWTYRTGLI